MPEYYDLEIHDDELDCAAAVGSVARIARELGVKPSHLYGEKTDSVVSLHSLLTPSHDHLRRDEKVLAAFGDEVGWTLAAALQNPDEFRDFTANGLRDVCRPLGVNWLEVLDGLA